MLAKRPLVPLLLVWILVGGGQVSCGSDTLLRSTALALLRKNEARLLAGASEDTTWGFSTYAVVAGLSLDRRQLTSAEWEKQLSAWPPARTDCAQFLALLEKRGLLAFNTVVYSPARPPFLPDQVVAYYTLMPQEHASFLYKSLGGDRVAVALATRSFSGISGIAQEGGHAEVEATIKYVWTPLGRKVAEAHGLLLQQNPSASCFSDLGDQLRALDRPATLRYRYQFAHYDDGWRLIE